MEVDEITREPLQRYERSPKTLFNGKRCIWACALRLMEADDPDAPAHISMIGHRMDLPEREIRDAVKNAAKRTGWQKPATVADSGVRELGEHAESWSSGDTPEACEVPAHSKVHGWPDDHPDCSECRNVSDWFAKHHFDQYWLRWVSGTVR